MARDDEDDDALTVAAIGGGALLAFFLLRGRWGLGGGGGGNGGDGAPPTAQASTVAPIAAPCRVRVDGHTISVNGVPADAPAVGRACRAAGSAEVTIGGDAIQGPAEEAIRELKRAKVPVVRKGGLDGDTFAWLWDKTSP